MPSPIVPGWAAPFTPEAFACFRAVVEAELERRGLILEYRDDGSYVTPGGDGPTVRVTGLARECGHLEQDAWEAHVTGVFEAIERMRANQGLIAEIAQDFERARPLLRAKLWPDDVLDAAAEGIFKGAVRAFAPGLALGLSLHLPGAVMPVKRAEAEAWEVPLEEAYRVAIDNTRACGLLAVEDLPLGAGGVAKAIFDGPYFLATQALFLDEHLPRDRPHGALVVVPHSGAVVFHCITALAPLRAAVSQLIRFARRAHSQAPRPLSPLLYWWREGVFEPLPCSQTSDGSTHLDPPESFQKEVLARLDAEPPS